MEQDSIFGRYFEMGVVGGDIKRRRMNPMVQITGRRMNPTVNEITYSLN